MTVILMILMIASTFFTVNRVSHKAALRFFEHSQPTPPVNRSGVLIVNDPSHTPSASIAVINEETYSEIDADFDTDSVMNSVTILWNRYTPATTDSEGNPVDPVTEEIPYGPYSDATSIDTWGLHPVTFKMQGVENNANISSKANAILAANKDAAAQIHSVTLPIRYVEDLTRSKALLDVGDLVTLNYARTNTSQNVRITGIKHSITPKSWLVTLEFARQSAVAAPQFTPAPPAAPVSTPTTTPRAWSAAATTALALVSGYADVPGASITVPVKAGDVFLCIWNGDFIRSTTASSGVGDLRCTVNGTISSAAALARSDAASAVRMLPGQSLIVSGLPEGNVVFKLQAMCATSGIWTLNASGHTTLRVIAL